MLVLGDANGNRASGLFNVGISLLQSLLGSLHLFLITGDGNSSYTVSIAIHNHSRDVDLDIVFLFQLFDVAVLRASEEKVVLVVQIVNLDGLLSSLAMVMSTLVLHCYTPIIAYLFTNNLFNFLLGHSNALSIANNGDNDSLVRIVVMVNVILVVLAGKVDAGVGGGFNLLEIGTLGTNDEATRVGRNGNLDGTLHATQ